MPLKERLRRFLCRIIGHDFIVESRAEPITVFAVCCRCGEWVRL